jgi:aryl sulfotransferase
MASIWWLASYPKSGNTWLRALIASLISGAPIDINDLSVLGGSIASSRALIDDTLGIESADLSEEQQASIRPQAYSVMSAEATGPIYLKVHDAYGLSPAGKPLFPLSATAGAIYIVRNPLDVTVSLAHYNRISMSRAVDILLRPDACLAKANGCLRTQLPQPTGNWACHVDSWLGAPFPVSLIRYEDLLARTEETFCDVVQFLKCRHGLDEIRRAIRDSSFDKLSRQENEVGFVANSHSRSRFFRRGVAGAWRDELPNYQVERINDAFGPVMRRLGY